MSIKFDLRSSFEAYGSFWEPNTPETRFTGRLVRKGKNIELTTSPEYKVTRGFPLLSEGRHGKPDVLLGFTNLGLCTLFWLYSTGGGFHNGLTNELLDFETYRVSFCILGFHIASFDADCLNSARLSFSGHQEWNRRHPRIEDIPEEIRITHSKTAPPIFDVCSTDLKCRLEFDVANRMELRASGEYRSLNESVLTLEPAEPKSLRWFLDIAYRFESYFSILLGTSSCLLSVGMKSGDEIGWLLRKVKNRLEKPDRSIWVVCDRSVLLNMAIQWVSAPKEFQPFEDLVYGTIRNSSLSSETEFLSLAQALEAFHRLTDSSTITRAETILGDQGIT